MATNYDDDDDGDAHSLTQRARLNELDTLQRSSAAVQKKERKQDKGALLFLLFYFLLDYWLMKSRAADQQQQIISYCHPGRDKLRIIISFESFFPL